MLCCLAFVVCSVSFVVFSVSSVSAYDCFVVVVWCRLFVARRRSPAVVYCVLVVVVWHVCCLCVVCSLLFDC